MARDDICQLGDDELLILPTYWTAMQLSRIDTKLTGCGKKETHPELIRSRRLISDIEMRLARSERNHGPQLLGRTGAEGFRDV